jgi:DUF1365 family protein
MPPDRAQVGFGRVMHARHRPVPHRFDYPSYFVRLPMHALERVRAPGFSVNRFNLLSFQERDHGEGGDALAWARGLLARHGIAADGPIWLTTYPRVLGYAFKPVSFWHCHAADGGLVAVLAEVNNTFGERHVYLLRADSPGAQLRADKAFHVSPFFPVRGRYDFRFANDPGHFRAAVDYDDGDGKVLSTAWWGRLEPLSGRACLRAFLAYPLMTWGVVARIHWQALRLWSKRVRFFRKPAPPLNEVTE